MLEISVVIPVRNGVETIAEQLDAVLAQDGVDAFEVVVVDNGSTDGTVELIAALARVDGRVRLIDGAAIPKGGAAAKNLGVDAANSDLIAFCDADDVVRPGWLRAVRDGLVTNPVVLVTREYWSLNPHVSHRFQPRTRLSDAVVGVPSISGGAFGIWRGVYRAVGGFDEAFLGSVDTEFAIRLQRAGHLAVAVPDAEVSVRLPRSARQMFRRRRMLARSWHEIERRHAVRGPDYSWRALGKTAGALLLHTHRLARPAERLAWAQTAGSFVGRLEARVCARRDRHSPEREGAIILSETQSSRSDRRTAAAPRILFLDGDLGASGGAQRSNLYIAEYLSGRGFPVGLLHGRSGELTGAWDRIVSSRLALGNVQLPRRHPLLSAQRIRGALRFAKAFRPDTVYCYSFDQLPLAAIIARHCRVPVLYHIRTPVPRESRRNRRRMHIPSAFIAVSRAAMNDHRPLLGDIEEHCAVISNGVDLARFAPIDTSTRASVRKQIGVPADARVIGYFGRLSPEKGVRELVRVHARITADTGLWLVVAGGASNELERRYEKELRDAARTRAVFLGNQNNVAEIMAALDVIVMPSRKESFGRVAIESLACGVPVVAAAVGGLVEILQPDLPEFLFPGGNEEALERVLRAVLAREPSSQASERLRRVAEGFDLQRVHLELEEVMLRTADTFRH